MRNDPAAVHRAISAWKVDRDSYYKVRALTELDPTEAAARFIYLNKTSFNGLYRVNKQGAFNVPFGMPKSSTIVPLEALEAARTALRRTDLAVGDFEATLNTVRQGDLVFADPPYVTSHNDNGFIQYNEVLFSWADQIRLAAQCVAFADDGVHVVVTNADHAAIRALYPNFYATKITRHSTLAGKVDKRQRVTELILSSTEPPA